MNILCLPAMANICLLALEVVVWRGGWRSVAARLPLGCRSVAAPWCEIHAGGGVLVAGGGQDMHQGWRSKIDLGRRSLDM